MLRRLALIAVLIPVVIAADAAGLFQPLDNRLTELRMEAVRRDATGEVVLVDVDSKSIAAIGRWPWPRTVHAELIDNLEALGAAEIAFDIDFSAPSTEADDAALEAALQRAGDAVLLAAFAQRRSARSPTLTVNRPIDRFARHAWLAAINVAPDDDGLVRRMPVAAVLGGEIVPSLAAVLAGGEASGDVLVDYSIDSQTIDRVPAIDVINRTVDRRRIDGKKVIVGAQAIELHDYFHVPVQGIVSGSLLQALGIETIRQDRALSETSFVVSLAGLGIIGLLAGLALPRVRWAPLVGLVVLTAGAVELTAFAIQWFEPVVVRTGAWHVALLGVAVAAVLSEIDIRRTLLAISQTREGNTRKILDQVIGDSFAGVVIADSGGRIIVASRQAATLLGTAIPAGGLLRDLLPAALADAAETCLAAADTEAVTALRETRWRSPEGRDIFLEYVATRSRLSGGMSAGGRPLADHAVVCVTFRDVTDRRMAEERISYLARFDTLTGLPNRNQLVERLREDSVQAGAPSAVVAFDIERIDMLNDTLGHDRGDLLVKAVAARAKEMIAAPDVIGRVGSGEFSAVFTGSGARQRAMTFAEEIVARAKEPYLVNGNHISAGTSAGIAVADGADRELALRQAHMALHRAKVHGGGTCAVFEPATAADIVKRQRLESDLWEAMKLEQFEVWYQPQVELRTGAIVGVEALLRWRHPTRGFIPPDEFIPVAEAVGMIVPLGRWVLGRACADAVSWPENIKLAVNISPVQLARGNLIEVVAEALEASGLPASRLDLEITEALFVQESAATHSVLADIADMGARFALDDFGTGYSSLAYIRRFPIDKIKIDRSFVSGLPIDQQSAAIVQAVATLAHSLGIHLNAEGVEHTNQVDFLKLLGFDEGQGYLFGRPMPAAALARRFIEETQASLTA